MAFENFYFSKIFQKTSNWLFKKICKHKFLERLLNGFSKIYVNIKL